jgi:hypothetical protein
MVILPLIFKLCDFTLMILKLSYHLPLFYDTIRSELIKWPRKK